MAKVKSLPAFLGRLESEMTQTLKINGIKAEIGIKPVPTTRLYRVYVIAPKFKNLKHTERQNLVWRIADRVLAPDEQMRISMILTLTPNEMSGK